MMADSWTYSSMALQRMRRPLVTRGGRREFKLFKNNAEYGKEKCLIEETAGRIRLRDRRSHVLWRKFTDAIHAGFRCQVWPAYSRVQGSMGQRAEHITLVADSRMINIIIVAYI
jgi:hypothetical protein